MLRGRRGKREKILQILAFVLLFVAAAVRAKSISRGFLSDLTSVAEGDVHHGYDSAKEAAELWKLGGVDNTDRSLSAGPSLQQLQAEDKTVDAQDVQARAAHDTTHRDTTAVSLALNRKLVALPDNQECKCARKSGWAVVKAARAQVLQENGDAEANAVNECPCQSAIVSVVTQVLQEKLEKLTAELGSRKSAESALRQALLSMRLPKSLAGELTHELDHDMKLTDSAKTTTSSAKLGAKESLPAKFAARKPATSQQAAAVNPETINIIVDNELGERKPDTAFSQLLPENPASPGHTTGKEASANPPIIVNVNNYIVPDLGMVRGADCKSANCDAMRRRARRTRTLSQHLKHGRSAESAQAQDGVAHKLHASTLKMQRELGTAVSALERIGVQSKASALADKIHKENPHVRTDAEVAATSKQQLGATSTSQLELQRRRLVDTARALEAIASHKADSLRSGAHAAALERSVAVKARMMSLYQLAGSEGGGDLGGYRVGSSRSEWKGGVGGALAQVVQHVNEVEARQRQEMREEDGFHVRRPVHGDVAARRGRSQGGAVTGGGRGDKPDFEVHSMLGHRGGAEEESGKAARQDIMSFYQDLQQHTKKKTLVHAPPNLRIGASEARDDLSNFYEEQAELEGITPDPKTGLKKGQTDPLYELAAHGRARKKHVLHHESAARARSDMSTFYKKLGFPARARHTESHERARFETSNEARQDLFGHFFNALRKEGREGHIRSRQPAGHARRGDAVHGWESTQEASRDLGRYFGQLSREGRHGHIKSVGPPYLASSSKGYRLKKV